MEITSYNDDEQEFVELLSDMESVISAPVSVETDSIKSNITLISSESKKSWVWKYCGRYPSTIPNSDRIVVCNICREKFKGDLKIQPKRLEIVTGDSKSTSNIRNHFHAHHRREWSDNMEQNKGITATTTTSMNKFLTKGTMDIF